MSNLVVNAGFWGSVTDWFQGLWIDLWRLIDTAIYSFINWMYRVFMIVAKIDIFGGGEQIKAITNRVYVIIGIAMLFIFAYNLVLLIINPDGKQIGDMGKIVKNAIISVILVTLLPTIFSYMSRVQEHVLESDIIGKIILGTSDGQHASDNKSAGLRVAVNVFSAFYHPVDESYYSCKDNGGGICDIYVEAYDNALNNGKLTDLSMNAKLKEKIIDGDMEYTYLLSTIAGALALWMFVSFALDIGVRVGKLALYQIVSPIPVMMRVLPNGSMFDKWFKGITNTYLSLFIRLIVIYFCMYAVTLVPDVVTNMFSTGEENPFLITLAIVVIILGILKFAQEAPKLISDLFGGGGDLDFSIGKKIRENKLGMGAMGAAGAGLGSAASNAWNSWKGMKNEKGFGNKMKALGKGFTSGAAGFVGGARRGAVGGYKSESFKGLGRGITQAKLDSDEARDKRAIRHEAYRNDGAIKGKPRPIISGVIGRAKHAGDSIATGAKRAGDWITNSNATEHRGEAINDVRNKAKSFKNNSYYNSKAGTISTDDRNKWLSEIRQGGKVTIGNTDYKVDRNGPYKTYADAEKAVKDAIARHNKGKTVEAYKKNADLVANDIGAMLKSLNDNQAAIGKEGMECFATKLKEAIGKAGNRSNAELQKLMNGDTLNMGEIKGLLSMDREAIANSSVEKRAALYEVTQALDAGMERADALNMQKKNEKK